MKKLFIIFLLVFGCFANNLHAQTTVINGNQTHKGFITTPSINNTVYVDGVIYTCNDIGINAAIAALGTGGGTVDATACINYSIPGGLNLEATVIVGANTGVASNGVLLKLGCSTSAWIITPTVPGIHIFRIGDNSEIQGCAYGGTKVFVNNSGSPSLLDVVSFIGNPANTNITENARVSNLWIENDNSSATVTNGLINLQTAYDSIVKDVKLAGYAPCLLYASDTVSGSIAPNSDDVINLLADGLDAAGTQDVCIQSVGGGFPGPIRFYGGDFGHPGAGKNLVLINTPSSTGHSYGIRFTNVYMEGNGGADTTTPLIAASDTEGLNLDGVWAGMNSTSIAPCLSLSSTLGVTGAITVKDLTCISTGGGTNAITSTVTGAPSFTGPQVTFYSANGDGLLASGTSSAYLGGIRSLAYSGSTSGSVTHKAPAVAGTNTITDPAATGTASLAVIEACGATSGGTQNCAKTAQTLPIIVFGDVTLNTATTQAITTLPFTAAADYSCSGSDLTTPAGIVSFPTYTSGAQVTIQETGGANTDHLRYMCVGF